MCLPPYSLSRFETAIPFVRTAGNAMSCNTASLQTNLAYYVIIGRDFGCQLVTVCLRSHVTVPQQGAVFQIYQTSVSKRAGNYLPASSMFCMDEPNLF